MTVVSTNFGVPGLATPPSATRVSTPGWRDPRLWIGVAIVAVSVIIGARVLAAADDTVGVWVVSDDVGAGSEVSPDDLEVRRIRFADPTDLDRYLLATESIPSDVRLTRGVGAGELLPRAALGSARDADTVEVPIAVEDEQIPGSVSAGSIVTVYVISLDGGTGDQRPGSGAVLTDVTVVDAPAVEDNFGTSGKRRVVLAVPREQVDDFFAELGAADPATITVVRAG